MVALIDGCIVEKGGRSLMEIPCKTSKYLMVPKPLI